MPDGTSVRKAFRGLAERQGELFSRAVLDGLLTGESTAAIARSLYGELGFSTEALTPRQVALAQTGNAWKMAKHQVRTLVRTSVNATANAASQQVYKANPEVTKKYRWVATLDNRTSPICRNLDQSVYEYGKGPTPANPPHFNCRSTTIPIIDYEGLGLSTPPNTQGYRPTTESRPSSRDPDGGRVPVNVSAAQHIYDLRGTTKSGKKAKFEPSAAQARMLNGGRDTAAGRQKARYFNRLADRYGPDGAMKRFMRTDGSEVSLTQLQQRYGKPDKITTTKPKPKAAAKPKPAVSVNPPKTALKTYTGENFNSVRAQEFRAAQEQGKKLSRYEKAQVKKFGSNPKHKKQADDIEAFLNQAPKYKGTVQRGMNMPQKDLEDMLAGYKAGNESLAMESWTSGKVLDDFTIGADQHVILRAKNKRGVDIAQYSEFANEQEVLMPTGSRYRLKGVQKEEISPGLTEKGIFRWIVDLEQS